MNNYKYIKNNILLFFFILNSILLNKNIKNLIFNFFKEKNYKKYEILNIL